MKRIVKTLIFILTLISFTSVSYASTTTYISCGGYENIPYDLPGLTRDIINIIRIIIPLLLIIMGTIDFLKVVFSNDSNSMKIATRSFITRIIAGVMVFFVILLVQLLIKMIGDNNDGILECISCFTSDEAKCATYEVEDEDTTAEKEAADAAREELEATREEKRKENATKAESSDSSSSSSSSSNSSTNTTTDKNIFIGDSRMVGMCISVTNSSTTKCTYSKNGTYTYGKDIYIAESGKGYTWFSDTAISAVNKVLSANSSTTYNIIVNMGVNDLGNINKYISKYKELSSGSWKNHNIIIVSVNPVDESKEKTYGYSVKQSEIKSFNSQMKSGVSSLNNVSYCDVYSKISSSFSTSDGLHYTTSTYKSIYNYMVACIGK